MTVGRPTDYDPVRTPERAQAYVDAPRSETVRIPTLEGLAVFLNVSRSTIYEWANKHPEFSDILEQAMARQAQGLIENGLMGIYNATITKLLLTKHGYVDKQEITGAYGSKLFDDKEAKARGKKAIGSFLNGRGNSGEGK